MRIAKMRRIVEDHQHEMIEGRDVDAQSANAYVTVYDALRPDQQANLDGRNLGSAISICWTLLIGKKS